MWLLNLSVVDLSVVDLSVVDLGVVLGGFAEGGEAENENTPKGFLRGVHITADRFCNDVSRLSSVRARTSLK
jgi:hypothetical protein